MNVRDWSLIIFTVLAQMAVGSFIVLGAVHFFAKRKAGEAEADRLSDRALLAIGPVLVLGLIASLFHLGTPLNAYRAIANFGSSRLSREIVLGILFAGLGFVFAIMQWRKLATSQTRTLIAWAAAIVGLVLVYAMARIYMLRTTPAWNTAFTPIIFFTTTFLLGTLAVAAAYVANHAYLQRKGAPGLETQKELLRGALRWFALVAIVLVGVSFLTTPLRLAYLASSDAPAANASVKMLMDDYALIYAVRLALVFLGAGVLGLFIYRNAVSTGRERVLGYLAYAAFVMVLVAEVLGRYLFYATKITTGL